MRKVSLKTSIPACLLVLACVALAVTVCYALSRKSQVDGQIPIICETPPAGQTAVFRATAPQTPSPTSAVPALLAAEPEDDSDAAVALPYWSDGILFENETYRSPTMSVTLTVKTDSELFKKQIVYYVADVRVSDVTQLRTACASGNFSRAGSGSVSKMAKREGALVAISGDYCCARGATLIIRNGEIYSKGIGKGDVCVLYRNGEMETIANSEARIKKILNKDPWQAWEFGPALLDRNGKAFRSFPQCDVSGTHPRSCIGYFEPGHYCFVVVDGRQKQSRGVMLHELALLMESLGCKQAFNLDGGASAHFFWKNGILNHPSGGGRTVADIIYVAYEPYQESRFYCGKAGLSK